MIKAEHLGKRFRDRVAVNDLSFTVETGKVTGFLGPNGAGKSTTMRLMLELAAGKGSTTYDGKKLHEYKRPSQVVGILLEAKAFHPTMALGTNGSSQQQFGGGGPGGGGFGRGVGISTSQVTAISSTSITTKDSSGNSNTYGINTNTLISDSGQQVDTSDISTGDTVIVIPSRIDTSTARRIIVNPDFGDQSPQQQQQIDPGQTQLN